MRLPALQKEIDFLSPGTSPPLWELLARIQILLTRLEAARTRDTDKIGILTLSWDVEYDEYYPISATPYLTGDCEDEHPSFGMVRPRSGYRIGKMLPFNHAEQINEMMEDGGQPEEIGYILGAAQERRRLLEMLGVPVKRWGE
jgi:hypothetical protein